MITNDEEFVLEIDVVLEDIFIRKLEEKSK